MKQIWPILASLTAGLLMAGGQTPRAETSVIDLTRWTPPDISTVGDDPFGKLVKYGHALFTNTANQIGPAVSDASKRLAGNNLSCQSCHLQARHPALCYAHDRRLGAIPAIPRPGRRG
jgi:thiosulfate dehydrogenase